MGFLSQNLPLFTLPAQNSSDFLQLSVSPHINTKHLPYPDHQSPCSAKTAIYERHFLMVDVYILKRIEHG